MTFGEERTRIRPTFRIKGDQCGNVWFVVLERMDIAFRGLLDELFVEVLSAELVLRDPLQARLRALSQQRRNYRCESAYDGS